MEDITQHADVYNENTDGATFHNLKVMLNILGFALDIKVKVCGFESRSSQNCTHIFTIITKLISWSFKFWFNYRLNCCNSFQGILESHPSTHVSSLSSSASLLDAMKQLAGKVHTLASPHTNLPDLSDKTVRHLIVVELPTTAGLHTKQALKQIGECNVRRRKTLRRRIFIVWFRVNRRTISHDKWTESVS